jgi:signal transduction histidine kinase
VTARPAGSAHLLQLRLPRRTVRARLAIFYFGAFLVSSAVLLAATVGVWQGRTTVSSSASRSTGAVPAPRGTSPVHVVPPQALQHTSDLHQLLVASVIALALIAALSVVLGWLVAGRFLAPLRAITATTRQISASNLHERLNLAGPNDEIKELGDTFDDLLGRLERSFDFERQFVANASHELRTPLATMRASLDVAMAKPGPVPAPTQILADRLRRELDQVDRLLESFLTLSQAQQGLVTDEAAVSLDAAAAAALERRSGSVAMMGLSVDQERCGQAWARGSETLLWRMVENVVDNAVQHNEQGGWIRIETAVDGPFVWLVAENGGPVIPQDEVGQLARPFRRLGAERTSSGKGNGLGLSIVRSIAQAHGGSLELQAREGGGLRVLITLPVAGTATGGMHP